jgi:hypothetical protein
LTEIPLQRTWVYTIVHAYFAKLFRSSHNVANLQFQA